MGDRSVATVGVLGAVELAVEGQRVVISRTQVRKLLAILAARPRMRISADVLIDVLWGDRLPADPRAALAVAVSRLRSLLGTARDCVVVAADGLEIDADVDTVQFEQLLVDARRATPTDAIPLLQRCLAMWRGEPFAEFDDLGILGPIRTRLDETRWSATTMLVDALVDTGAFDRAISIALPAHEEQPQRELLTAALARALASEGRKGDALDVIAATRSTLRDDLGLDLSAALVELESAVLHGSVDLRPATRGTDVGGRFVGRTAELEQLTAHSAGVCAVVGEPGVGKSALLGQVVSTLRGRGIRSVSVTASETPERPLECVAEIIEQLLNGAPPSNQDPTRGQDPTLEAALARVVPSIVPAPKAANAMTRDVLVSTVSEFIIRLVPRAEAVLVIDDCQWLDSLSARVFEHVAASGACLLIAGARPTVDRPATWLLDAEADSVEFLNLSPLSHSDIEALLIAELGPRASQIDVSGIHERSGGNALFVAMLIELIAEGDDRQESLPSTVLVSIQRRLSTLSSRARQTLQTAAVIGTTFPLAILRQVAPEADADLAEAVAARLVVIDAQRDEASFVHTLVAQGAYGLLAEGRRVQLHDEIGEVLEAADSFPAEYARHFSAAAALDPYRAANAHLLAARAAAFVYSWEEVESHALQGLGHLGETRDVLKAELAVLLGRAQRLVHRDHPDDALLDGAAMAREIGDVGLFSDAVVALLIQSWSTSGSVHQDALELFEEALSLDLPKPARAQLCAAGSTFAMSDQHAVARERYHEALEIVLTLDDPTLQAEVLRYSRWGLIHPADLATLSEVTTLLTDLAGHDPEFRWGAATNRFAVGTITADRSMVDLAMVGLRGMHASLGTSPRDWEMEHVETAYAIFTGDHAGLDERLDRMWNVGTATTSPEWLMPFYAAALVGVRRAQGRLGEIVPFMDRVVAARPEVLSFRSVVAGAAAAAGDADRTAEELDLVAVDGFSQLIPDATWSAVVALLSDAVCFLGDEVRAHSLIERAAPYARRMTWSGVTTLGPIDDSLARLHALVGNNAAAAEYARSAQAMVDDIVRQTTD